LKLVAEGKPRPDDVWARLRGALAIGRLARPLGWSLLGAAVASALFVAMTRPPSPRTNDSGAGPVAPTFRVPAAKLAVVRIEFFAEQPVDEVEFAVALPDGLKFVSGGRELDEREFRWRAPLDRGANAIPVAVRGRRAGRYRIEARVTGGGVDATHDVVLEVTG
jgi:hypothetical protein